MPIVHGGETVEKISRRQGAAYHCDESVGLPGGWFVVDGGESLSKGWEMMDAGRSRKYFCGDGDFAGPKWVGR